MAVLVLFWQFIRIRQYKHLPKNCIVLLLRDIIANHAYKNYFLFHMEMVEYVKWSSIPSTSYASSIEWCLSTLQFRLRWCATPIASTTRARRLVNTAPCATAWTECKASASAATGHKNQTCWDSGRVHVHAGRTPTTTDCTARHKLAMKIVVWLVCWSK